MQGVLHIPRQGRVSAKNGSPDFPFLEPPTPPDKYIFGGVYVFPDIYRKYAIR